MQRADLEKRVLEILQDHVTPPGHPRLRGRVKPIVSLAPQLRNDRVEECRDLGQVHRAAV